MPILETDVPFEKLKTLAETNQCKDCGSMLVLCWGGAYGYDCHIVRCTKDVNHEGIAREAYLSPYAIPGFNLYPNLDKGRKKMVTEQFGREVGTKLAKYHGALMTKAIATEIVETLWGGAPAIEKTKAILLCHTYQLNPLMRHLYLVGYKQWKDRKLVVDSSGNPILTWSMMMGIGATRLLAQRRHSYSYLDMTPRKATKEEIEKILGDTADSTTLYAFTHIRDSASGAEAFGLRGIGKDEDVKGEKKGNTRLNQACIRSERLALDRQYPGEMPQGVEVVDERFIEAEYEVVGDKTVAKKTGEIIEPEPEPEPEPIPEPIEEALRQSPTIDELKRIRDRVDEAIKRCESPNQEPESEPDTELEPAPETTKLGFDADWLTEALKTVHWSDTTVKSYLKNSYLVDTQGTVIEVVARLTREQKEKFFKAIQDRVDKPALL